MDHRAAKGIAANIRTIVEATTYIALIDAKVGTSGDPLTSAEARREYAKDADKAQAAIANWLTQPMTWR